MAVQTRLYFKTIYPGRSIGLEADGVTPKVADWNDLIDSALLQEDSSAAGRALLSALDAAAQLTLLGALPLGGGTMTGQLLAANGSFGTPGIGFAGAGGLGFYYAGVAGTIQCTASLYVAGTDLVLWDSGSGNSATFTRYGAGKVLLAGTTPMLALGGSSSSYPAWKRSSAAIHARLADDSADANVSVAHLITQSGYIDDSNGQAIRFVFGTDVWFLPSQVFGFTTAYSVKGMFVAGAHSISWQDGGGAGNTPTLYIDRPSAGIMRVLKDGSLGAAVQLAEMTAPGAPAADNVLLYAEDNGGGKTRLMALFSSGAAQQVAIQP